MVNKDELIRKLCDNAWKNNAIGAANILEKAISRINEGENLNLFISESRKYYSKYGDYEVLGTLNNLENLINEVIPAINRVLDEIEEYGEKISEYGFEQEEKLKKQRNEFNKFKEEIVECIDRSDIYSAIKNCKEDDEESELYKILKDIYI